MSTGQNHFAARRCPSGRALLHSLLLVAIPSLTFAWNPTAGDFSKMHPQHVRVMSWNAERVFISDPSTDGPFNRIITAMQPDVLVMQEVNPALTEQQLLDRINSLVPAGDGAWNLHRGLATFDIQTIILSRYPMILKRTDTIPVSDTRGVTMALVDLPNGQYPVNLYLMGVHLKCCGSAGGSEDESRQRSADAIVSWMGDARQAGGNITLNNGTPMLVLGDFNLVGGPQPEATLRTGDIQNEATFGADIKSDWDISDLLDVQPRNPINNALNTWSTQNTNLTSRLDRFYLTDSVAPMATRFVFNTATLSSAQRIAAGVNSTDNRNAADHLPIIMDLAVQFATITLDRAVYTCGDTATITVNDPRAAGLSSVQVLLENGAGATVPVILQPGTDHGTYTRQITLEGANIPTIDGTLRAKYTTTAMIGVSATQLTNTATLNCANPTSGWIID